VGYREHDRGVWATIFREAPDSWLEAPPSALMRQCADFLREQGVERVFDLGSGFGRWSHFLSRQVGCRVVGIDYAVGGCHLARELTPPGSSSGFVTGEITALPFADHIFDGFLAVLILDNVAEAEGIAAVRELHRVTRPGSAGFVVLNPWPMPDQADSTDNPTRVCTRRDYSDEEALELLLSRWRVLAWERVEHDLRAFRVRS
jgi:SAM-dependent methyltransferase